MIFAFHQSSRLASDGVTGTAMERKVLLRGALVLCVSATTVFAKGSGGGKGGSAASGGAGAVIDPEAKAEMNRKNWLIYGPVLCCIFLITLCLIYDKINNCLRRKHGEELEDKLLSVRTDSKTEERSPTPAGHYQESTNGQYPEPTLYRGRYLDENYGRYQDDTSGQYNDDTSGRYHDDTSGRYHDDTSGRYPDSVYWKSTTSTSTLDRMKETQDPGMYGPGLRCTVQDVGVNRDEGVTSPSSLDVHSIHTVDRGNSLSEVAAVVAHDIMMVEQLPPLVNQYSVGEEQRIPLIVATKVPDEQHTPTELAYSTSQNNNPKPNTQSKPSLNKASNNFHRSANQKKASHNFQRPANQKSSNCEKTVELERDKEKPPEPQKQRRSSLKKPTGAEKQIQKTVEFIEFNEGYNRNQFDTQSASNFRTKPAKEFDIYSTTEFHSYSTSKSKKSRRMAHYRRTHDV